MSTTIATTRIPAVTPDAVRRACEEGPDDHDKDRDSVLPGRVAAGRVDLDRLRYPRIRSAERNDGRLRGRRRKHGGDGHENHRHQRTESKAPAEDGHTVVAQALEIDAPKHERPASGPRRRRARSSAGRCPRGWARSWAARPPETAPPA